MFVTPMYAYTFCKVLTSIPWPQSVHFHYFKVCYKVLVENNFMVDITQNDFPLQVTPFLKSAHIFGQRFQGSVLGRSILFYCKIVQMESDQSLTTSTATRNEVHNNSNTWCTIAPPCFRSTGLKLWATAMNVKTNFT